MSLCPRVNDHRVPVTFKFGKPILGVDLLDIVKRSNSLQRNIFHSVEINPIIKFNFYVYPSFPSLLRLKMISLESLLFGTMTVVLLNVRMTV